MFHDIDKALDVFEADPDVAVIVLEGAGERGLCADSPTPPPITMPSMKAT
ncbi:hypothetical protein [Bradyrhizobium uaiense]